MSIDTLHNYAVRLRDIGMLQVAGDFDYLVAWIKSTDWTGGKEHLPPHPAGSKTDDINSNHCPIPYIVTPESVAGCTDFETAKLICQCASNLIDELSSTYISVAEQTALDAYSEYIEDLIETLNNVSCE